MGSKYGIYGASKGRGLFRRRLDDAGISCAIFADAVKLQTHRPQKWALGVARPTPPETIFLFEEWDIPIASWLTPGELAELERLRGRAPALRAVAATLGDSGERLNAPRAPKTAPVPLRPGNTGSKHTHSEE